jgi:hypothetical protein
MNRNELRQTLLYSDDVRAFATPEEFELVGSNEATFRQFVAVLNEVDSAPYPLPDELHRRLLQACETIVALFPSRTLSPTSVSVIVECARRCISEGIS